MLDTGADISDCGTYRYRLWRYWDADKAPCCFVMLNPSTADAASDDPTIRKCIGFAKRFGFGGIEIVNLFAYRATDPRRLLLFPDREGKCNDAKILSVACAVSRKGGKVIVAWGAHPAAKLNARGLVVFDMLCLIGVQPYALGFSKEGQPNHPLMLSYDRELVKVSTL